MELSLSRIKAKSESISHQEEKEQKRKHQILILVLDFLQTSGYLESAETFRKESGLWKSKMTIADNIDLSTIIHDFEAYYNIRFGKDPKIIRKSEGKVSGRDVPKPKICPPKLTPNSFFNPCESTTDTLGKKPAIPPIKPIHQNQESPGDSESISIEAVGTKTGHKKHAVAPAAETQSIRVKEKEDGESDEKLLRPMPFYQNSELRELASIITKDIFVRNPNVRWQDIEGLEKSKKLIKEAIVFPIKYPEYLV
jgi:katanin p60 ATPase-containing subunit A1